MTIQIRGINLLVKTNHIMYEIFTTLKWEDFCISAEFSQTNNFKKMKYGIHLKFMMVITIYILVKVEFPI